MPVRLEKQARPGQWETVSEWVDSYPDEDAIKAAQGFRSQTGARYRVVRDGGVVWDTPRPKGVRKASWFYGEEG